MKFGKKQEKPNEEDIKIIGLNKQEKQSKKNKKINKKKIVIASIIAIIILILVILIAIYMADRDFRDWADEYILFKDVQENNLPYISIDENENNNVYAYNKYITVLSKNTLKWYNSIGKEEATETVEISSPLVATSNRFFLIADNGKQKIYLFSGTSKVWEKELEGNISRVTVNDNGYVCVVLAGTSHKSVMQTFDSTGKELFKIYLGTNSAVDVQISKDNKYLAFAEVITTGTTVQSMIKIVSIEKAQKKEEDEPIIYTYKADANALIIKIKYQDSGRLVCMYDTSIHLIQDQQDEELLKITDDETKVTLASIELSNYIFRITEKSILLNTVDTVEIMNISDKKESIYTIETSVKEIVSYEDTIAINIGSEVHFIGTNGWLVKKYTSTQEVRSIVIASDFAGIVYRNKIELIQF